jgi:hypothetical protein
MTDKKRLWIRPQALLGVRSAQPFFYPSKPTSGLPELQGYSQGVVCHRRRIAACEFFRQAPAPNSIICPNEKTATCIPGGEMRILPESKENISKERQNYCGTEEKFLSADHCLRTADFPVRLDTSAENE